MANSGARRPKPPETGTRQRTARNLLQRLDDADDRRERFELVQLENDHADTDPVAGLNPKTKPNGDFIFEDGKPVFLTYGEAFAEIAAGKARLWEHAREKNCDKLIEAMLKAREAAEDDE